MIIVKLQGGLGNQMFQYAVGRVLAYKNKVVLKYEDEALNRVGPTGVYRLTEINAFNISASRLNKDEFRKILPNTCQRILDKLIMRTSRSVRYYKEGGIDFNESVLNFNDNYYLDGYWQSWKYFNEYKDIIKKDFTLKDEHLKKIDANLLSMINNNDTVGIHIRRGDYVANKEVNKVHGICEEKYYKKAIEYIKNKIKKPIFYIFSDDPEWCKKKFGDNFKIISGYPGWHDMYLMSRCKHQIIANSSFSWWAAWLNDYENKIIIAPKTWFIGVKYNIKDRILNNWINL